MEAIIERPAKKNDKEMLAMIDSKDLQAIRLYLFIYEDAINSYYNAPGILNAGDQLTLLIYAVYKGYLEIVKDLIKLDACLSMRVKSPLCKNTLHSALDVAISHQHSSIVDLLIEQVIKKNLIADLFPTACVCAAKKDEEALLEKFLSYNVSPNAELDGKCALYFAIKNGYARIITLLTQHDAKDPKGLNTDTFLLNHLRQGKILIFAGPNITASPAQSPIMSHIHENGVEPTAPERRSSLSNFLSQTT